MKRYEANQKISLPLEAKIILTQKRIKEFYDFCSGEVYVSFSGGKDSTVLLDIVRKMYPGIPAVFVNTGLEYPEIVDFVKSKDNVIILKPKMNFKKVLEVYGYPVVSKIVSKQIRVIKNPTGKNDATVRLYKTGIKRDGTKSKYFKLPKKWEYLLKEDIKISEQCCDIIKKRPFHDFAKKTGLKGMNGVMASDSKNRMQAYLQTGCNSFNGTKSFSKPLSFWTTKNIWEYIKKENLDYSSIYDKGVTNTGCIFCMFGVHMEKEPNRFQMMKETHPKLYKYCMEKLELSKVLDIIGVKNS